MKEIKKKTTNRKISTAVKTSNSAAARSRKFLAVFDGLRFSQSTLEYAIKLTQSSDAFLTGIFLDDAAYRSYNAAEILSAYRDTEQILNDIDSKDLGKRDEAVRKFQKACDHAGIDYTFRRETDTAIHELIRESIFSDLVIINENETFTRFKEKPPTRFIKELLADVQCPVLIVPSKFKTIDKITLLYDGGPSSVFAIKMFSYLFYMLNDIPVDVVTVKEKTRGTHLPNNKLMREFIKRHFPRAKYIIKKGNPEEQIAGHLRNQKGDELVVLGAYRRGEISRWFKTSMADLLMKELETPLFVANNK